MKKEKTTQGYLSIKKKLITTVAMLLVATFMVASSSYAWFTLSTAPEVTGIKTSVGSNGSLEIALLNTTKNDVTTGVGTSGDNTTWGNLIDLTDGYGLDTISLLPAVIALSDTGAVAPTGNILATPTYGADGRVATLLANAAKGKYENSAFTADADAVGVTGIGTASNMSTQQIEYRNAKSKVDTALKLAKRTAENALAANGADLVDIILSYVNGATEYDVAAIGTLLTALEGTPAVVEDDVVTTPAVPGVADYLEEAMTYYIVAIAASANPNLSDTEFDAMKQVIVSDCTDGTFPVIADNLTIGTGESSYTITTVPAKLATVYAEYNAINTAISNSKTAYNSATTNGTATTLSGADAKTTVSGILTPLMNVDQVTVNGYTSTQFSEAINANDEGKAIGAIAAKIMKDGAVKVDMPKDSGVFADIASVCGNIESSFNADVSISLGGFSLTVEDMAINMKTSLASGDITLLTADLTDASAPANRTGVTDQKLTTLYGYALDFVFRTNASGSNLMLQTTPANRIYSSGGSSATQGNGSSMTFEVLDERFTTGNIQELIANIRIVFTSETGEILATAVLDAEEATAVGTSVTADIKLCEAEVVSINDGDNGTIKTLDFLNDQGEIEIIEPNAEGKTAIVALNQNEPTVVSVYVYLDGQTVENSDVAFGLSDSTTGTMNLQFSSDANLVPMEYYDLMDQGN